MIFPYYLNPQALEVIQIVKKARYNVVENISWCAQKIRRGRYQREQNVFYLHKKYPGRAKSEPESS